MHRIMATLGSIISAALLSACASNTGALPQDTAAQIGDTSIAAAHVDRLASELHAQTPDTTTGNYTTSEQAILTHLIAVQLARTAAERQGINITPQQLAAQWLADQLGPTSDTLTQGDAPEPTRLDIPAWNLTLPGSASPDQTELRLLVQALAYTYETSGSSTSVSEQIAQLSRELNVTVNPRYGTWDHDQLALRPASK